MSFYVFVVHGRQHPVSPVDGLNKSSTWLSACESQIVATTPEATDPVARGTTSPGWVCYRFIALSRCATCSEAMNGTLFRLSYGPCVGVKFGRSGMPEARRKTRRAASASWGSWGSCFGGCAALGGQPRAWPHWCGTVDCRWWRV